MEIYNEVLQMSISDVINHPLLAYDESIDEYIREPQVFNDIDTDEIYSLFFALATRHINIEEKEENQLKYLFQSIERQLIKISRVIEPDIDQFISALEYADLTIINFLLYFIFSTNNVILMEDFINAILECNFDEDRNFNILYIFKNFYIENELNESLFIILVSSENWKIVLDLIESSVNENEKLLDIINGFGDAELLEYFN